MSSQFTTSFIIWTVPEPGASKELEVNFKMAKEYLKSLGLNHGMRVEMEGHLQQIREPPALEMDDGEMEEDGPSESEIEKAR